MLTKYRLTIDGVEIELAPDSIRNWADLACSYKRSGFSGVMRSLASEIEFVGEIADELKDVYLRDNIRAKAAITIYVINDSWGYEEVFTADLDFSTISWDESAVKLSCIDNSLESMIQSRKSTKYEYEVGKDIPFAERLAYDRVEMLNTIKHTVTGLSDNDDGSVMIRVYHTGGESVRYVSTYICGGMETYENNPIISTDQTADGDTCMFEAARDVPSFKIHAQVMFDTFNANTQEDGSGQDVPLSNLQLVLCKQNRNDDGSYVVDEDGMPLCTEILRLNAPFEELSPGRVFARHDFGTFANTGMFDNATAEYKAEHGRLPYNAIARVIDGDGYKYYATDVIIGAPYTSPEWSLVNNYHTYKFIAEQELTGIVEGDRIFLGVDATIDDRRFQIAEGMGLDIPLYFPLQCNIKTQWSSRAYTVELNTLRPLDVAQALLDKVTDGKIAVTAFISGYDSRIANTRIIAAESIRGLEKAKLYSSFSDFCSWMETVFGYTYTIRDNVDGSAEIHFVHRAELFGESPITYLEDVTEASYEVDASLLYSSIEIGYNKTDYNKECGRDEWNFTTEYTTGYEAGDSKLTLKSPYRADCYGMEFLAQESKDSKDDKSDNNVFFVLCNSGVNTSGLLTIDRTTYPVSGAYSNTVFNGGFSPAHCLKANEGYISSMDAPLVCKYASTGGNSTIRISGVSIESDVTLRHPLLSAGVFSFEADILADIDGVISVDKDGMNYTGYIEEVDMHYAREEVYKYKIRVKGIS